MKLTLTRVIAFSLGATLATAAGGMLAQTGPTGGGDFQLFEKIFTPGGLAASTLLALNVIGFIRGWIVPAWVYKSEQERANRMEAQAWKSTEALIEAVKSVGRTSEAVLAQREKAPR